MGKNIESHPFKPFYPQGAKLLLLGSFPPPEHNQSGERNWDIRFFYGSKHNLM
ncbi:MAG: hypothetical protein LBD08_03735 [Treponema sp.]|nr:hypothetical protein [Treponema sp.]